MFALGEFAHALADGVLKSGDVAREDVVHIEARSGEDKCVVDGVLHGVGNATEIELLIRAAGEIKDRRARVVDVIRNRGARVNDVAVGGDNVAVNLRIERRTGGRLGAGEFHFRRGEKPADGGRNFLDFRDGNTDDFVNRIRQRPVQARAQQHFLTFALRLAEAQNDGFFLRSNGEKSCRKNDDDQRHHRNLDDDETAAQRLGQRL